MGTTGQGQLYASRHSVTRPKKMNQSLFFWGFWNLWVVLVLVERKGNLTQASKCQQPCIAERTARLALASSYNKGLSIVARKSNRMLYYQKDESITTLAFFGGEYERINTTTFYVVGLGLFLKIVTLPV